MPAVGRIIPWFVLAFALVGLALGLYEWSHPPFTDDQLKASLADTWEVATSTTRVFAFVFLGLGMICVALARKASDVARIVAYLAAVACLITLFTSLRNHVALTERAVAVSGADLGPLWGLL
jgi:energy-converting hydrogenase Eha subunit C